MYVCMCARTYIFIYIYIYMYMQVYTYNLHLAFRFLRLHSLSAVYLQETPRQQEILNTAKRDIYIYIIEIYDKYLYIYMYICVWCGMGPSFSVV